MISAVLQATQENQDLNMEGSDMCLSISKTSQYTASICCGRHCEGKQGKDDISIARAPYPIDWSGIE